jgi:outer membrane protein OmpA-like peptidoglycan-associated protein
MLNMLRITLLFLLTALASSCAVKTVVALVPDPDGRTGSVSVRNEAGGVALGAPYRAITIGAKEGPSAPENLGKKAVDQMFADALSIQPAPPLHFQLYFHRGTKLLHDSEKLLPDIVAAIRERNSAYITVIGHTDTLGEKDWNVGVSNRRAVAVKDLLVKQGVDANTIQTLFYGEEYPTVPTADEVWEPKNRQVEVIVR